MRRGVGRGPPRACLGGLLRDSLCGLARLSCHLGEERHASGAAHGGPETGEGARFFFSVFPRLHSC